ncbi:MAG TPA: PBP1A family penicillin-binding protein [Gemmatimonadaceae bacterium]|nr:PBP1A family penicillin-binding protein [Gemmatimonadaceae bacterium]
MTTRRRLPGVCYAAAALLLLAWLPAGAQQAQQREPWMLIQPPQSSLVLARDGSLIGEIGSEWRTSISIRTLPAYVGQAFVAVEDKRFYQHDGVDVIGIGGAIRDALGGDVRGASTITQLVVGNMHPAIIDRRDRGLGRKLREQAAAREMERRYTKEQILEAFLNQIHFGNGWFGIEAASRHYFGKSATHLSVAEAASLAALPKGPALYDPIRHAERNRERRNIVLSLMAEQGYISRALANRARGEPVVVAPGAGMSAPSAYFVDVVRVQAERAGIPVMDGGYRIHTTLDPALQRAATVSLVEGTAMVEMRAGYPHSRYSQREAGSADYLQGAVVAMDPVSGDVLALVGGRNHQESPFNRAVNGLRQPGSAFKPFVYAAALADSMPPSFAVADTALAIPLDDGTLYEPRNADGAFMGMMTLREALARSRNPVAVDLARTVGMDSVIAVATRLGLRTPIAPYPSSAIGASAVRPLDLVAAYAPFANMGSAVEPRFIERIEDRAGRVVHTARAEPPRQVLDPRIAFIVRDMMRDAVEQGTGASVRRSLPASIPAAGKTGTTNDNTDVWFVGMTPEIVAGVWLGFDMPKSIMSGAGGGSLAAPIWASMMARYYEGRTSGEWAAPGGLVTAELDRVTGELADTYTPGERRYTEYFIPGTEPESLKPNPWKIFQWGPIAAY